MARPRTKNFNLNSSFPSTIPKSKKSNPKTTEGEQPLHILEQARLDKIQAEIRAIDLKNAITLREYIPISEVSGIVSTEYTRVRSKLLSLEAKLPHILAPIIDPIEIKKIVQREVAEILTELSATEKYKEVKNVKPTRNTKTSSTTNTKAKTTNKPS